MARSSRTDPGDVAIAHGFTQIGTSNIRVGRAYQWRIRKSGFHTRSSLVRPSRIHALDVALTLLQPSNTQKRRILCASFRCRFGCDHTPTRWHEHDLDGVCYCAGTHQTIAARLERVHGHQSTHGSSTTSQPMGSRGTYSRIDTHVHLD